MFNPPGEMTVGKTERIEVRISRDPAGDMTIGLMGSGAPVIENINVSEFMCVKLIGGDSFSITPMSIEEQRVTLDMMPPQWDFDVTPKKSGSHTLTLSVSVRVKDEEKGSVGYVNYPVYDRRIDVQVNPLYSVTEFVGMNWQWLVAFVLGGGTSIVGIIKVVIPWWKKKPKKRKKKNKEI